MVLERWSWRQALVYAQQIARHTDRVRAAQQAQEDERAAMARLARAGTQEI